MTPLSSISTSGPDMSVAMSVELGTSTAVEFDDRMREIHDTGATQEIDDTVGASSFRNPSQFLQSLSWLFFENQSSLVVIQSVSRDHVRNFQKVPPTLTRICAGIGIIFVGLIQNWIYTASDESELALSQNW